MRRPAFMLAAFAAAALVLAPVIADARPGGGSSMGSRGARTYNSPPSTQTAPGSARQMDRTITEPGRSAAPSAQPSRPFQPNPAGGFFSRSPLMAGLMGGLIGAGIGGLLFGHGLFGGMSGFASILGLLLQIGIVVLLVRFAMAWFRRRQQPALAGMPAGGQGNGIGNMAREAQHGPRPSYGGGGGAAPAGEPIQITPADFQAFENTLKVVNAAWSRQDEQGMRSVATPEMMQYFGGDLADLARRGWRNETRDVVLEKGDLAEAWREGAREYATVAMRFSQVDVTRRISDGTVVEGDPERRVTATELWTFVRTQGGPWMLSAIQQTS